MMKLELKPCPFCGGDAEISSYETESLWSSEQVTYTKVSCSDCDIAFQTEPGHPTQSIAAWNRRSVSTITPAEAGGLVGRLRDRAESYRMGGPSSEHTAALLDEAATTLASERAAHAETKRERDEACNEAAECYAKLCAAEARLAEALKALEPFAAVAEHDIGDDETDDDIFWPISNARYSMSGRLRVGHLRAARRVREGGKS